MPRCASSRMGWAHDSILIKHPVHVAQHAVCETTIPVGSWGWTLNNRLNWPMWIQAGSFSSQSTRAFIQCKKASACAHAHARHSSQQGALNCQHRKDTCERLKRKTLTQKTTMLREPSGQRRTASSTRPYGGCRAPKPDPPEPCYGPRTALGAWLVALATCEGPAPVDGGGRGAWPCASAASMDPGMCAVPSPCGSSAASPWSRPTTPLGTRAATDAVLPYGHPSVRELQRRTDGSGASAGSSGGEPAAALPAAEAAGSGCAAPVGAATAATTLLLLLLGREPCAAVAAAALGPCAVATAR
jgi:hypothetical protein